MFRRTLTAAAVAALGSLVFATGALGGGYSTALGVVRTDRKEVREARHRGPHGHGRHAAREPSPECRRPDRLGLRECRAGSLFRRIRAP